MADLLVRPADPDADGRVIHITPKSAGWRHVGFDLHRLSPGQTLSRQTGQREVCLVLVAGAADVDAGEARFENIGGRTSPFEDKAPGVVFVPHDSSWTVTARTDVELAVCSAPGGGDGRTERLIEAAEMGTETRGKGANTRHVRNILPDSDPTAHSLLVVEVITPPGNWSSYPPHKHDTDSLPEESLLEETYYHRLDPPQGFAFQRVYTDDRSLDETMTVHNGDVVCVPRGYHPAGTPYGYQLYYLNVMAGPTRKWVFRNDPEHEWMIS
ncbi:MAG: 5-deoxy-glucuronate isomerase [Proteobacteria bacterium]|nr:5-deoxy-glucuronate isomerase [Pseudomonadota bacterium]